MSDCIVGNNDTPYQVCNNVKNILLMEKVEMAFCELSQTSFNFYQS